MRHRKKRLLEVPKGDKSKKVVVREMLTNLVTYGKVTTTFKRAKVLKSVSDDFFAKLVELWNRYEDESSKRREVIRYTKKNIFGKEGGKKVVDEWLPKYLKENRKTGFVTMYRLGYRKGDGAEKIVIKLI